MSSRLFDALAAGAVLVTDKPVQAQQFRLSYAHWKRAQGVTAWVSPAIVSWSEWLKGLGEDLLWSDYTTSDEVPGLLSPLQEQAVWEQAIRAEVDHPLMHLPSTAALARAAWGLIHSWHLPDPSATQHPSDDVRSYALWVSNYVVRCKAGSWIDQARLADVLRLAINDNKLKLPRQLLLAGFIQFTPQQTEFMSALKSQGTAVSRYTPEPLVGTLIGHSYVSMQDEFYALALWCREQIEQDPRLSIGIVIPSLEQNRAELEYILRKTLYPDSLSSEEEFVNNAYQFSTGETLADSQVANLAMNVLDLMAEQFSVDQVSRVLRNPYCSGGRAESGERLKMDAWLRRSGVLEFDLARLLELLKTYRQETIKQEPVKQEHAASKITAFERSLIALACAKSLAKGNYPASVWAKHFYAHLDVFAWPGTDLNSAEQGAVQTMQSCISEFATLDFVQAKIDLSVAMASLRRLYQGKRTGSRQSFAPIQILDLKHVYGLSFDRLWVAQLSDKVLPESSQTNPLIPYAEQCATKISGATPELRLLEAQRRLEHLRVAARQTIFSYASEDTSGQVSAPAMLRDIEFTPAVVERVIPQAKLACEWIEESYGPVYAGTRKVGTSVFRYQAECPFKAFAKTRLLPVSFEKASYGLTALERGSLLHSALEKLWLTIKNSESLRDLLHSEQFESTVSLIIDKVLGDFEARLNYTLSPRVKNIEQTRLLRLTQAWLQLESERAPFALHRSEYPVEVEINGLQVKGRIDRIDTVNDVGFAVIDYKSGVQTAGAWFRERPDQPQMPIYALAQQNNLVAIVYANLKPGELGFKGFSEASGLFPDIKAFDDLSQSQRHDLSWQELIPYWREQLNALAHDYQKGLAVPDPKKGVTTCRYCELETLCRVNASRIIDSALETAWSEDEYV